MLLAFFWNPPFYGIDAFKVPGAKLLGCLSLLLILYTELLEICQSIRQKGSL